MPNSINRDQDSDEFLKLISSSTNVYSICKRISSSQTALAVIAASLGPLLAWLDPSLRVWAALAGIMVLVLDAIILDPWLDRNRQLGTKIQELFDTRLFQLRWNKLKCGALPDQEAIGEHARAYQRSHPALKNLREWYPPVGDVPLAYARLICQRSNLRWDMSLRKRYAFMLLITLVVLTLGGLGYAVWSKLTAEQLVMSVLVPVLPLVNRLGKESKEQYRVADDLENQKSYIEDLWQRSISESSMSDEQLLEESRRLQDAIFDRRLKSPRVPDLLHRFLRDEHQVQMEEAAKNYVTQIKLAFGKGSSKK